MPPSARPNQRYLKYYHAVFTDPIAFGFLRALCVSAREFSIDFRCANLGSRSPLIFRVSPSFILSEPKYMTCRRRKLDFLAQRRRVREKGKRKI
jgi:hypothetical protein